MNAKMRKPLRGLRSLDGVYCGCRLLPQPVLHWEKYPMPNLTSKHLIGMSLLSRGVPKAAELHQDSSRLGQEAYLRWLSLAAAKLQTTDLPTAKLGKYKGLEPASMFGVGYRGKPFFTVEWRMEPGAFLPPHCHPNVSVCTVGLEGEARIRNYEIVGEAPEFTSTKSFKVRETHNEVIGAGRINTLSALRDNIHTFQAGKNGARGLDITTYHGADVGFSHLELSPKPMDEQQRIFEAVWKKL